MTRIGLRLGCKSMSDLLRTAMAAVLPLLPQAALPDGGEVWFGPNDFVVRPWKPDQRGPLDFMQLFIPGSPWGASAHSVRYFQTNSFLFEKLSDTELQTVINNLRDRGMKLAVEDGGIEYDPLCGKSVEGYVSTEYVLANFQKVQRLGGVVDAYVADSPYWAGTLNPDGCQWSPTETAQRTSKFAAALRTVFPAIAVGSVEIYETEYASDPTGAGYLEFLDAFRVASGKDFAFLHYDDGTPDSPNWYPAAIRARDIARGRGLPFGIIYNGNSSDTILVEHSDEEWLNAAKRKMLAYELRAGAPSDHAIIESWVKYPTHVLPETDPTAHTNLILYYTRPRTYMESLVSPGHVQARLVDSAHTAISNVAIQLIGNPISGPGLTHDYVIEGTVPAFATQALIALRVNVECEGCGADTSLRVYDTLYSEGTGNSVPNHDFSGGKNSWGISGSGSTAFPKSDRSAGSMLSVVAARSQTVMVNSSTFSATANATYTVRFTAQVAPSSFGGGYFCVIFLGSGSESSRERSWFPFTIDGGHATTDAAGRSAFDFDASIYGSTVVSWLPQFAGDDQYWPSTPISDVQVSNYQGLWWATGGTESGWGINFAHQGDQVFATWYTYDTSGKAWWLSMLANRSTGNTYSGPIYVDSGPPFNSFVGMGRPTQVGTGTVSFTDVNNGSFGYTVNTTMPATVQTKSITRYDLGTGPQPTCTYSGITPNFAGATNYQDLWWVANGAESGWGINFAHQGNDLFATWYTYDSGGTPLWLSSFMSRQGASNVYGGPLTRTSGPRFDNYKASDVVQPIPTVGTATLTFADGNHAAFNYATDGSGGLPSVNQTKAISRYPFAATGGTLCQ